MINCEEIKQMENYLEEINELVQAVADVNYTDEWTEEGEDEWGDDFSEL